MAKDLILTIDLEWYYNGDSSGKGNVFDFEGMSLGERFSYDNGQIERSTETILKILKRYNQKITFFVVAEIDKVYPKVIKKIYNEGHEIAYHSYNHNELKSQKDLNKDLKIGGTVIKRTLGLSQIYSKKL